MYLKLKEPYVLRGWDRLPYAIQHLEAGETSFLREAEFRALSFCNGKVDIDSPAVLPVFRELALKAKENGIAQECTTGENIEQYQKYNKAPCRYIKRAHWSITGKCNLKCRHCYMSAPQAKYGELPLDTCLDIVRQLKEANIAQVSITGGEPLVRKDFWEIVDALIESRITISQVYSNGWLVDNVLLDKFDERNIKPQFSLSFDGVGWHDWLRGVEGAEEKTVEAIKLLVSRGFDVDIETAIHKGNADTLKQTLDLFVELGVKHWKVVPASDSGNWLDEAEEYTLDVEDLYDTYLQFIPEYRSSGAPISIMLGGFFMCQKGSEEYSIPSKKYDGTEKMQKQTLCMSARTTMYISADGKLLPCIPLTGLPIQEEMPSLLDVPLCKALSDSVYLSYIDKRLEELLKHNEECSKCEYKYHCGGGCRAGALMTVGEYMGRDEYVCSLFMNGYEQKIAEIYS